MSKIIEERRYSESKWDAFKNFVCSIFSFIGNIIKIIWTIIMGLLKIVGLIFSFLGLILKSVNLIFTFFKLSLIISVGYGVYYIYSHFGRKDIKDLKNKTVNIKNIGQNISGDFKNAIKKVKI